MGRPQDHHETLVGGIHIASGRTVEDESGRNRFEKGGNGGTLTGLATRQSDGKKVLVTNLHCMTRVDDQDRIWDPIGDEEMYQSALPAEDRIPDCLEGVPLSVVEGPLPESPSIPGSHPRPLLSGTKI